MKPPLYLCAIILMMAACNAPDQNSAAGNRVDSLNTSDDKDVKGPGVDNSGGTRSTGTFTDSSQADSSGNKVSQDSSHHH